MAARRVVAVVVPLAVLLGTTSATVPAPVSAEAPAPTRAGVNVRVENSAFTPSRVSVAPGDTVTWSFVDEMTHNSTSAQLFWSSGPRSAGGSYAREFTSSGKFGYLCTLHPHMQGVVKVRLLATGSPSAGWVLRWATAAGTDLIDYDVQVRRPGSKHWKSFRTDTLRRKARFDPARNGTYTFRARTARDGTASGWSPRRRLTIS